MLLPSDRLSDHATPQLVQLFPEYKSNEEVRCGHQVQNAGVETAGQRIGIGFHATFHGLFAHGALRSKIRLQKHHQNETEQEVL